MDFPEGYGKNWDAFWDMINRDCEYHYVTVKGSKTVADELKGSVERMRELLEKNKQYWEELLLTMNLLIEFILNRKLYCI